MFIYVIAAFVASLIFVRAMITLGPKLGFIDLPDERRIHTSPVPRAGGFGVWLAFAAVILTGIYAGVFEGGVLDSTWLQGFIVASAILVFVGMVDDRFGMPATVKLAGQAFAASVLFFFRGVNTGTLLGYEIPLILDLAIWVVWTVAIINSFNLIDGMDGLCAGLGLIATVFLSVICFSSGKITDGWVMLIMAATLAGFLRYNFHPAKIFLGDTGSMFIGLFVASSASVSVGERTGSAVILIPLLVAGIPLFDVILAVWRRTARRFLAHMGDGNTTKIFGADKDHLHHRLLSFGLSQRKVATLLYCIAVCISVIVLLPSFFDGRALGLTVGAFGVCGLIGFRYIAPIELRASGDVLHLALKRPAKARLIFLAFFCFDAIAILASFALAQIILSKGNWEWLNQPDTLTFSGITLASGMVGTKLARAHSRHWGRASVRDYLSLAIWFLISMQFAFTIFTLTKHDIAWSSLNLLLLTGMFSIGLMIAARSVSVILRESIIDSQHRRMGSSVGVRDRVVLYGAGDLGELFISHLRTTCPAQLSEMRIVGFIDDHPNLKGRVLNGFQVHGAIDALPQLKERFNLKGIVITSTRLDSEKADQLNQLCEELDIQIYRWRPNLQLIQLNELNHENENLASIYS
jgi:UDP-GlcNAc:undecaprenyl-phosphate/decaprenyl-phosphate GlcNAc-1-phosphate transferase